MWHTQQRGVYLATAKATISCVAGASSNAGVSGAYGVTVTLMSTVSADSYGFYVVGSKNNDDHGEIRLVVGGATLLEDFPLFPFDGNPSRDVFLQEVPIPLWKGSGPVYYQLRSNITSLTQHNVNIMPVRGRPYVPLLGAYRTYGGQPGPRGTELPAVTSAGQVTAYVTVGTTIERDVKALTFVGFRFLDITYTDQFGTLELGFGTTITDVTPIVTGIGFSLSADGDTFFPKTFPLFWAPIPAGQLLFARQHNDLATAESSWDILVMAYS